jgi:hypothetical protein
MSLGQTKRPGMVPVGREEALPKQNPENADVFGTLAAKQTQEWVLTFFYPDYTVGPGITPGHACVETDALLSQGRKSHRPKKARGLYHRSGIHSHCVWRSTSVTLPRRFEYSVVSIITIFLVNV